MLVIASFVLTETTSCNAASVNSHRKGHGGGGGAPHIIFNNDILHVHRHHMTVCDQCGPEQAVSVSVTMGHKEGLESPRNVSLTTALRNIITSACTQQTMASNLGLKYAHW